MISTSLAGVQPHASRRTAACGTLMSANMRAIWSAGVAIASSATARSQRVIGDEGVEAVEVGPTLAIHLDHAASFQTQARLRVVGAVGDDQPGLGPRLDERLFVDVAFGQDGEAAGCGHGRS